MKIEEFKNVTMIYMRHVGEYGLKNKELMETLKPQDLDWSFIAENVDAWVEKAELEYVQ